MPRASTGKTIEGITVKRKRILLTFYSGETLTLTPDQYTQDYFYVGKVISDEQFLILAMSTKTQPLIDYGFRLLSKGRYTEYQIREKLYRRDAIKSQVDLVIDRLKQAHLIDDAILMKDWVDHYQRRGYGRRYIEMKLFEKGFAKGLVHAMHIDAGIEKEMIKKIIDQLKNNRKGLSQRALLVSIKNRLLARGFDANTFSPLLASIGPLNNIQESEHLLAAFQKAKRLYGTRYQGITLQEKMINFLLRKGYNYANIKQLLKESYHDD